MEAYDENYEPLTDEKPPADSRTVDREVTATETTPVAVPMLRKGVFEIRIPVFMPANIACG
jgi:hypothetical protein